MISMVAGPVLGLGMIVAFGVPDAMTKAAVLARTISHAMNCSPAGVAAVVVWLVAARRVRRAQAE